MKKKRKPPKRPNTAVPQQSNAGQLGKVQSDRVETKVKTVLRDY